jgi:hypothetical protein
MGDTKGKDTILVKEMWWEGSDFHIIDINDKHHIYKNASVEAYSVDNDDLRYTVENIPKDLN